jgi:hypothetical protein
MSSFIEKITSGNKTVYNITLTRGDYFAVYVNMQKGGEAYTPPSDGTLRFALKKKYTDPDVLILKDIPLNTGLLELQGSDTKQLAFGKYEWDIEYTDAQGHPDTILEGTFKLDKEVY